MAQPTLEPGSKRDRQLNRILDVIEQQARAKNLTKAVEMLTQNRQMVKMMLLDQLGFKDEVVRPTVDWPDGPPPEMHPSEWSPVDRVKGNIHALSAISNPDKYTQAELAQAAAEYSSWLGIDKNVFGNAVPEAIGAARDAGRPLAEDLVPGGVDLPIVANYATAPLQEGVWRLIGRLHDKGLLPGDDPTLALLGASEFERNAPSGLKIDAIVSHEVLQKIVEARGGWRNRRGGPKKLNVICPDAAWVRSPAGVGSYELVIDDGYTRPERYVFPRGKCSHTHAIAASHGGVEVHLEALMLWASTDERVVAIRERRLKEYYFLGAYALPKGLGLHDYEPQVVSLLKKREAEQEIDDYDRPIVEGLYFRTTGRNNTAGPWILPDEGDETEWWRYGVTGPFDPDGLRKMRLRPLIHEERAPVERPRRTPSEAREADRRPRKAKRRTEIKVPASARLMGARIASWREMAKRNAQIASNGVDELEDDLRKYLGLYGNPHEEPWAASVAPEVQALLQAVLPDGSLSPDIFSKDFQRTSFRGDKNDVLSVTKWMCERVSGGVKWGQVLEVYEFTDDLQHALEEQVGEDNKLNVVWNDGSPMLYTDTYFLSGDLYVHLDAMEPDDPEWLQPFYERQRSKLLDLIEPQNVMQMNITLRDPLVPLEAMSAYMSVLNFAGERGSQAEPYQKVPEDRLIVVTRENSYYSVQPAMTHWCIQSALDNAVDRAVNRDGGDEDELRATLVEEWTLNGYPRNVRARCHSQIRTPVRQRIALMNRESKYRDDEADAYKAWNNKNMYGRDMELDDKIARDADWDSEFQSWIAGSEKWGPLYAEVYNRAVRGTVAPLPDSTDLGLCRVGPVMMKEDGSSTLYNYQTEAVRKVSQVGGGLIALDVGLGKTFTATALLAYWRQIGQAKRPIIAVPKQVLLNWKREINSLLPDYDVLVVTGSKEQKATLWKAWIRGEYDVCVCTKDNFQDVKLTPPELLEVLNGSEWLRFVETRADFYLERLKEDIINQEDKARYAETDKAVEYTEANLATLRNYLLLIEDPKAWATLRQEELERQISEEPNPVERYKIRQQYEKFMRSGESEQFARRDKDTDMVLRDDDGEIKWKPPGKEPGQFSRIMNEDQRYIMSYAAPRAESEEQIRQVRREVEKWDAMTEEEQWAAYPIRFSQMNCDLLIADESHKYKNLWKAENRYGKSVRFLPGGRKVIQVAVDFFTKSSWVRNHNNQRGVVTLTATPVTNSPMEIYNQIYCIAEQDLQARGLGTKELFVDRFCRIEFSAWVNTAGLLQTGPTVTQFQNMDELRQTLGLYMEFKTLDDVDNPSLVVPESETTQVFTAMTPAQETIYDFIRTRFGEEGISTLAILAEATDAALDQRLILDREEALKKTPKKERADKGLVSSQVGTARAADEALETNTPIPIGEEGSLAPDELYNALRDTTTPPKFAACAQEVLRRPGCGHVVFLDRKGAHPMLIKALVAAGIPRDRIGQIMGDGAYVGTDSVGSGPDGKERVATALNGVWERDEMGNKVMVGPPKIDVLLGTASMAEGMNLQMRGCAIHHLDLPWTSAIVQQRNGRAVRQGNVWSKQTGQPVDLIYYVARRSADSIRMQAVMGKKGWISTLFESTGGVADNPMMASEWNEEAVIELFSLPEDFQRNMDRLEAHRQELRTRQIQRGRSRLKKQFRAYSLILGEARTTTDSAMAKTIYKQATAMGVRFEAIDDDIWGGNRYVIEMARDKVISWVPPARKHWVVDGSDDFIIIENEAATTEKSFVEALAEGVEPELFSYTNVFMVDRIDLQTDRCFTRKIGAIRPRFHNIRELADGGYVQPVNELWDYETDTRVTSALLQEWSSGTFWHINFDVKEDSRDFELASMLDMITPDRGALGQHPTEEGRGTGDFYRERLAKIFPSVVTMVNREPTYETWNFDVIQRLKMIGTLSQGITNPLSYKPRFSRPESPVSGGWRLANVTELNAANEERVNGHAWAFGQMMLQLAVSPDLYRTIGHLSRSPINYMPFRDRYRKSLSLVVTPPPLNAVAGNTFGENLSGEILGEKFFARVGPQGPYEFDALGAVLQESVALAAALAPPEAYANITESPFDPPSNVSTQTSLRVGFLMILAAIRYCYNQALQDVGVADTWTEKGWAGEPVLEDRTLGPGNIKTTLKRAVLRRWASDPEAPTPWEVVSAFDRVARVSFNPRQSAAEQLMVAFAPLPFLMDEDVTGGVAAAPLTDPGFTLRGYAMERFACIVPTNAGWQRFLTLASSQTYAEDESPSERHFKLDKVATQWFQKKPAVRKAAFVEMDLVPRQEEEAS